MLLPSSTALSGLVLALTGTVRAAAPTPVLPPQDQALVAGLAAPMSQRTLANGLRVVVLPDHRAPVVTLHLQVPYGSARDTGQAEWPDRPGLAHFVEHLLYAGSPHAPDGAYDRLLSAVGGENNAWTEHDAMAVHATVPVEALELALYLEADRMVGLDPASLAARLDPERRVVEQERNIDLDSPGGLDPTARRKLLYPPGHPDHWPVIGTPAALGQVGVDTVQAFHAAAFSPGHAVLVLVGDIEPDQAWPLVERWLGAVPPRAVARALPAADLRPLPRRGLYLDDVDGVTLYAVYPLPLPGDPALPAADLLADWLGQQRQGHLGRLRHRGRLQRLAAWVEHGPRGGRLVVELGAEGGSARRLLRQLDRAVAELARAPPDPQSMERVRARWRSWAARIQEDPGQRAEIIAGCMLDLSVPDCFPAHVARHLAVDAPALSTAAATWLAPARRALLVVTSPRQASAALPRSVTLELDEHRP